MVRTPVPISAEPKCSQNSQMDLDNKPDHHFLCPQTKKVVIYNEESRWKKSMGGYKQKHFSQTWPEGPAICPVHFSSGEVQFPRFSTLSTWPRVKFWYKQCFTELYSWQNLGNLKNIDAWASSHRDFNEQGSGWGPSIRSFKSFPHVLTFKPRLIHCTIKKWCAVPRVYMSLYKRNSQ